MPVEMTKEQLEGFIQETIKAAVGDRLEEIQKTHESHVQKLMLEDATNKRTPEKGIIAARMIRALAACKGDVERAAKYAKDKFQDDVCAKALAASDATAGGFTVPEVYVAEIIELLRPASVVRKLNPTILPMNGGNASIPKLTGGSTASYTGENTNIPKSQPTFGQLKFAGKKLVALVPISNDLLRYSSPAADAVVRDDMVASISQREDQAFIRDDGTQSTPKGIKYWAGNTFSANATVNLANVVADLGKALLKLQEANSRMLRPAWILAPRTAMYLSTVMNANGVYVFRDEMLQGRLWGLPYGSTTQVPTNLGGGSDASEIILADMADVVIADSMSLEVTASTEASYHDGTQLVSAFSQDQTVIRAITEHDLGVRHEGSVCLVDTVKWFA